MQENLCTFGIRYIFYAVRKAKHNPILLYPNLNYEIVDVNNYEIFEKTLSGFVKKNNIDVIGVSFMSYQVDLVKKISKHIKNNLKEVLLVGGGVHTTAFPEDSLQYFDAICIGEGEISFINFLDNYFGEKKIEKIDIPGTITKYTNKEKYRQNLPFLQDLDFLQALPILDIPTYILSNKQIILLREDRIKYYNRYKGNSYDITTSRGCPLHCTYCSDSINKNLYGNKWSKVRIRNVEHVISELKYAVQRKPTISFINFHDDSFSSRPIEWLEEFVLKYNQEIKLPLMFRIIPGSVKEQKLELLSKLNIIAIGIGLQSGSYRVLKDIYNRPIKINVFTDTIAKLNSKKIIPIIDVMLNNPYEKREDIIETIKTLSMIPKPFLLELYGFRFYPGTEITSRAIKDGIIDKHDSIETQAYIEDNKEKKYLNNIIYITPCFPGKFIFYLIGKEKNLKIFFSFVLIIGSFLNLFSYLNMILKSQRYNIFSCFSFFYNTLDVSTSLFHVFPFLRHLTIKKKT